MSKYSDVHDASKSTVYFFWPNDPNVAQNSKSSAELSSADLGTVLCISINAFNYWQQFKL